MTKNYATLAMLLIACTIFGCDSAGESTPMSRDLGEAHTTESSEPTDNLVKEIKPIQADGDNDIPNVDENPDGAISRAESLQSRAELHKRYTREFLEVIQNNTRILRTIHDARTAEASLPELRESMANMNRIKEQVKQLGRIPEQENALLTTPLGSKMLNSVNEFTEEMERLQSIPEAFEITRKGLDQQPIP